MDGVGSSTITDPTQNFIDPAASRGGPGTTVGPDGQPMTSTDCADGKCGQPSTSSANGSCSGGSCGGSSAAYQSPGCSSGKCGGGSKSAKTGSCGSGGCGGSEQAQKSDCADGQCGGKKGLFKATMMTVAASELAQLSIDYSQYLS
jgi:hypothetical protein